MRWSLGLLVLAGCPAPVDDDAPTDGSVDTDVVQTIDAETARRLLVRASVDLRGVRPSVDELAAVAEDPMSVEDLLDDLVDDPRTAKRVADRFADVLQTVTESHDVNTEILEWDHSVGDLSRSIGQEPVEMVRWIVDNDLPFTDLVTADWTMANEVLSDLYPVDYLSFDTGWHPVRYTDGRPGAGILSSNGLWLHYGSLPNNQNRGRASQVSRILLCDDYVEHDAMVSSGFGSQEFVDDAVANDPGCVSCHRDLDPLASHFYGFWGSEETSTIPSSFVVYATWAEDDWMDAAAPAPAWMGVPTAGLADLGVQIAQDPRFTSCMVERAFSWMLGRAAVDDTELTVHQTAFKRSGWVVRELLRSVVHSAEYADASTERMVDPRTFSQQVFDLTGYRWVEDDWDLVAAPETGFLLLAGGADGTNSTQIPLLPTPTQLLVYQRLAEAAAAYTVEHDRLRPLESEMFTEVDFSETLAADRERLIAQLHVLHRRVLGTELVAGGSDEEILLGLWADLYNLDESDSVEIASSRAWVGLLAALIRDPGFLYY